MHDLQHYHFLVFQDGTENDTTRFYQWVVFMLLIQAGAFRIPHLVWKFLEGGLIKAFYLDGNVKSAHNRGKNDKDKGLTSLVAEKAEFFINIMEPENYKSRVCIICWLTSFIQ